MVHSFADLGEKTGREGRLAIAASATETRVPTQLSTMGRWLVVLFASLLTLALASPAAAQITFTINTGNSSTNTQKLLIDSNNCGVDGPSAAFVGGVMTNSGTSEITNVSATMSGLNANVYFTGGQVATQSIGTLSAGDSIGIYWFVGYSCAESATATPTISITSSAGNQTTTINLEIFNAISANAGGNVNSTLLGPGAVVGQIISMDVEYSFGGANVGDEYFLQPAGNTTFNAGCFRLVAAEVLSGIVSAIPIGSTDQMYFVAGIKQTGSNKTVTVRYFFQYLCAEQSTVADPYAAQTSGSTNIKYTGNFGSTAITYPPGTNPFTITKTVSPSQAIAHSTPGTLTYTVTVSNPSPNATVIDRIVDVLPSEMSFVGFVSGSDVTALNSSSVPSTGATGTLTFEGRLGTSYYLPGNGSVSLIYSVSAPTVAGTYNNSAQAHFGTVSTPVATAAVVMIPAVEAFAENGTGVGGVASTPISDVRSNDLVGGVMADADNSTIAESGRWPSGFSLNTTTGAIIIDASVAAGTYSLDYQLCSLSSPTDCESVTDTVTIAAPEVDLAVTKTNGTTEVFFGSTTTYTVTVTHEGGDPITGAVVTDTPGAGLTCDAADPVTITGDGVPVGSFTIADITGAGIALDTLSSGQSTTLNYSCQVN